MSGKAHASPLLAIYGHKQSTGVLTDEDTSEGA